jgi:hypothetical protein
VLVLRHLTCLSLLVSDTFVPIAPAAEREPSGLLYGANHTQSFEPTTNSIVSRPINQQYLHTVPLVVSLEALAKSPGQIRRYPLTVLVCRGAFECEGIKVWRTVSPLCCNPKFGVKRGLICTGFSIPSTARYVHSLLDSGYECCHLSAVGSLRSSNPPVYACPPHKVPANSLLLRESVIQVASLFCKSHSRQFFPILST